MPYFVLCEEEIQDYDEVVISLMSLRSHSKIR